jgi:cephalosporin-C deacetylase-like acetyl esterase
MSDFAPETCHQLLLQRRPALAYSTDREYESWRESVRLKLNELLGDEPELVAADPQIEERTAGDGYTCRRLVFTSEPGAQVPCSLLLPTSGKPPFPVIICLQGHTTGAHISLGRPVYPGDEAAIQGGDRDFALQAVARGYAALAIEQRCFGERLDNRPQEVRHVNQGCHHASLVSLLLGRSMIRERAWDVQRAIDVLESIPEIDSSRIGCMGNSGGGTVTWFAACLEPRISIAMPSCYVCSLRYSIGSIDHCADNYLPGMLKWFDLGDLACLIAPRPLVVVAGSEDNIFPIEGVHEAFNNIQEIYSSQGAGKMCRLVVGAGGHRFYADDAWPVFSELSAW